MNAEDGLFKSKSWRNVINIKKALSENIYDMIFLYPLQEFLDLCSCPLSGVSFPIVIAPPRVSSPLPHPWLWLVSPVVSCVRVIPIYSSAQIF
jgi:hypothetical protein